MINPISKLALPILYVVFITGCASVTRGNTDELRVSSTPDNANVVVYRLNAGFTEKEIKQNVVADKNNPGAGPLIATTPAIFKLARKGNYKVEVSKEGYKTTEVLVTHKLSGAGGAGMAGNILAGGIVGMVVDSRTGATQDLTPNPINILLEKGEGVVMYHHVKDDDSTVAEDGSQKADDSDSE